MPAAPPAALLELGRISEGLDGGFFIRDGGRPPACEGRQRDLRALEACR